MLSRHRVSSMLRRTKESYERVNVFEPGANRTTLFQIASTDTIENVFLIAQHLGRLRNFKSAAALLSGIDCFQLPIGDRYFAGRMMSSAQDGVLADQLLRRTLAITGPVSPSIAIRLADWIFISALSTEEKLRALTSIAIESNGAQSRKISAAKTAIKYREFMLRRAALEDVNILEFFDPTTVSTEQLKYVPHLAALGHKNLGRAYLEEQLAHHGYTNAAVVKAALKFDPDWTQGDFSKIPIGLRETSEFLELAYQQKSVSKGHLEFYEKSRAANIERFPALTIYDQNALLNALFRTGHLEEMEELIASTSTLPDTMLSVRCALGMRAMADDRYYDARDCFLRVLEEDPSDRMAANGVRFSFPRSGGTMGSISKVRDVIGYGIAGGGRPGVRFDIAAEQTTTLLMEGKYRQGLYAKRLEEQWRMLKQMHGAKFLNYETLPRSGGRLFLIADEGVGDEVRTAQFYAELSQRFSVTSTCDPRLQKMLARSFPDMRFIPVARRTKGKLNPATPAKYSNPKLASFLTQECAQHLEDADHITFGQTLFFNHFAGNMERPAPGPYMKVDSATPLPPPTDKLKVGLIWRSHVRTTWRQLMYLKIEEFAPLFDVPGVEFWSVQHAIDDAELEFCRKHGIRQIEGVDLFDDFEGFAPHLKSMDLVVGISTLPMELAASLGTSVWMLGYSPENYFLRTRGGTTPSDQLTCNSTVIAPDWIDFSMPHKECVDMVMKDARDRLHEISSRHRASA